MPEVYSTQSLGGAHPFPISSTWGWLQSLGLPQVHAARRGEAPKTGRPILMLFVVRFCVVLRIWINMEITCKFGKDLKCW